MTDTAIVGMACLFPGAPDVETFWRNVTGGVDAISDAPASRLDPAFYAPAPGATDRLYCRRGGFVDAYARFDPVRHGVMPVAAKGAEPDQLLALEVATRAIADAGYLDRPFARARTGVIIGRGNYPGSGRTRLDQHVRTSEQLVAVLRGLLPHLPEAQLARVKTEFQAALPSYGADAAIGLVPNLTASRIANRLDLHGPAFTIDAACASALIAVDHACAELAGGRCDVALAGGVHLCQDEVFWSVFCQLGALSRQQQIRPFDRRADGLLIGEGIGLVVLKRRRDAERDGDRVYALIQGTGVASDGREASLMNPSVEGQVLALERAWRAARIDPRTIGLVEAHGTGTPAGDAAELETLRRFFGPPNGTRAALGSVKSMIGHTMPAAGAAGLIKAALAAHHGILPPTLHCEEPHEAIDRTRFRIVARAEEWRSSERRAAVNAFGFGGINAHVIVEGVPPSRGARPRTRADDESLVAIAADSPAALLDRLSAGAKDAPVPSGSGCCRLALLDPTPDRLERARAVVSRARHWTGHDDIWFTTQGLLVEGRLAFVFPGVDATFRPRVLDLASRFGLPIPAQPEASDGGAGSIEATGASIIRVNRLIDGVLRRCGIQPDVVAGHSIGEWSAMIAAGMIPDPVIEDFVAAASDGGLPAPDVVFAAAGCGLEKAAAAMKGLPQISLSHDNCPHQVVLCGIESSVDAAIARLRESAVLVQKLPFRSGFHTPLFAEYVAPHRERFASLPLTPPQLPLWSATSCAEYPADPEGVRALAVDHLLTPVRFRELIERLHASGVRVFVQAGTGSLVQFIEDILRGRPHLAIAANVHDRGGMAQLRRTLAALWTEGADVDLATLWPLRRDVLLDLGVPIVRSSTPLAVEAPTPAEVPSGPLAAALAANLDAIARAQREVVARLDRPDRQRTALRTLSLETFPELRDHTFFRQPDGWPVISDRHPVVPMTGLIEMMIEEASRLVPGQVPIAVEDVRAFRWLVVSSPVEARFKARRDGTRVAVQIEGYAEAVVCFASSYPDAPPDDTAPLADGEGVPCTAETFYADRWMFHGPAYRGVVALDAMGSDGIRGVIETKAALGALLDNAGQLFGFWVMARNEIDRMAMPVAIERLRFFGPPALPGERFTCTVRIRPQEPRAVRGDIVLGRRGRAWCRIEGWEDRRFETDARFWAVLQFPERNLLAEPRPEGWCFFADRYRAAPTREQLARRFLGERERADYDAQHPRAQRSWLSGRIAAKDAVRDLLWRQGNGPLFPVEVQISSDARGRPRVSCRGADVRVSLAHSDGVAVALAAFHREPGIDVERVEERGAAFVAAAFSDSDLTHLPDGARDEWLTRLWAAKEAAGKARGTGLAGDPRRLHIMEREGERLLVDGLWVETRCEGTHAIAWTTE